MMSVSDAAEREPFQFTATLLDSVACGIIVVAPDRSILVFNDVAERILKFRAADALGHTVSVLPPPLQAILDETLLRRESIQGRKVQWSGPKQAMCLQISAEPEQADGKLISVLLRIQDARQAHEIARNLERLDRLANLGLLGAGIAHEIKNALVAVRTFVDLLQEKHKDDELSQLVSREILRIDDIVKQVLRDAAREEFTLAPLSLHHLLQDSIRSMRHQFQIRSIQLDLRLNAAADRISGDERQLRHAFLNLLINALEALNSAGRVTIATENVTADGRACVRLVMTDTGGGIRPEHLPQIFNPFFTTKKEGTGLGLAITQRIVRAHEGQIRVESSNSRGTSFELLLPQL